MASTHEGKVLQLAMAFGQGAGSFLASEEAAVKAVSRIETTLERAFRNWQNAGPIATSLVRTAGQMAAQRAIERRRLFIDFDDIDWEELEKACGCLP